MSANNQELERFNICVQTLKLKLVTSSREIQFTAGDKDKKISGGEMSQFNQKQN